MSMMCKLAGSCESKQGMCIHEMIMLAAVIIAAPLVGHFLLHWF